MCWGVVWAGRCSGRGRVRFRNLWGAFFVIVAVCSVVNANNDVLVQMYREIERLYTPARKAS